jgi:hypothetical protein
MSGVSRVLGGFGSPASNRTEKSLLCPVRDQTSRCFLPSSGQTLKNGPARSFIGGNIKYIGRVNVAGKKFMYSVFTYNELRTFMPKGLRLPNVGRGR